LYQIYTLDHTNVILTTCSKIKVATTPYRQSTAGSYYSDTAYVEHTRYYIYNQCTNTAFST